MKGNYILCILLGFVLHVGITFIFDNNTCIEDTTDYKSIIDSTLDEHYRIEDSLNLLIDSISNINIISDTIYIEKRYEIKTKNISIIPNDSLDLFIFECTDNL